MAIGEATVSGAVSGTIYFVFWLVGGALGRALVL